MGLFDKIKAGLTRTRAQIQTQLEWMVKGKSLDESAFDGIEEAVILADGGVEVAEMLVAALRKRWGMGRIKTEEDLREAMADEIEAILLSVEKPLVTEGASPYVILTLGVNGVGKTTTIAKLAAYSRTSAKRCSSARATPSRAAAIEQLEIWGERLAIDTIKHRHDADPAAVAFDATKAAKARGIDVLILDTAGRLHTKVNLMEEMRKIKRVVGRELPGAPHETLLVVDATKRSERHRPADKFRDASAFRAWSFTKLDGTARRLCPPHRPQPGHPHQVRGGRREDGRPRALQGA